MEFQIRSGCGNPRRHLPQLTPIGNYFGHIGLSQINRTGEGGRGLALAGPILGHFGLAAWIVLIVFYASVFTESS